MPTVSIVITNITKRAGTERAVVNLSNILSHNNYAVTILSVDSTAGNAAYNLDENVKLIHLGLNIEIHNPVKKLLEYKKLSSALKKHVKDFKVDYLIGTLNLFNCIIANIKNVKTIGCEHFNFQEAGKVHRMLRKINYKKLDSVVLLTEKDRSNYSFLNNTTVIPNSLSFISEKKSDCLNKEIISVGRLSEQKGFDLLIEAAKLLKYRIPDWHISVYGTGPDKDKLFSKIKEYQLEKFIEIKPPVDNIIEVYTNAGLYVSSSRWEGLPMVLIEASSCGLPAVAFDCNYGPSDVIADGKSGYLCNCFNIDNLVEKISELCKDESKRVSFGKEAVCESIKFSTDAVTARWIELLQSI